MKLLPVGISSFSEIRNDDYVYVDKTAMIAEILRRKYYFLSRPRRFGKSLLVDTIKEMFSGSREIFQGLAAYDTWNWEEFPVVLINFADGGVRTAEDLRELIDYVIQHNARRLGVELPPVGKRISPLGSLISSTFEKYSKRVVVLVDEYDKPLLDNVISHEVTEIRDVLRNFYGAIKAYDSQLRFVLLTGVSKFSKVSIFSGLNNLLDISVDERYSALCGYTQKELETNFAPWLDGINLADVKEWYNGYGWEGEKVYNPFDVLLFLDQGKVFRPHWFETGTPTFLVKLLQSGYHHLPDFEDLPVQFAELNKFDIGQLNLVSVLFQSGYLTIKKVDRRLNQPIYHLGFPNLEVKSAFSNLALEEYYFHQPPATYPMYDALLTENIEAMENSLRQLFASIANDNYRNNTIASYEGYYAAVVYAYFASLGMTLIAEDVTNRGRIDLTIQLPSTDNRRLIYICVFKVASGATSTAAIDQIKQRNYADKYRAPNTTIHLIGMEFDPDAKTLATFHHELG